MTPSQVWEVDSAGMTGGGVWFERANANALSLAKYVWNAKLEVQAEGLAEQCSPFQVNKHG